MGRFVDVMAPLSTCAISEYFAAQDITLCEGQHAEAGLEACDWISEIGRRLERGYVLTIDYGHPAADLFDDHHMRGTLLAYQKPSRQRGFLCFARRAGFDRARQFHGARILGKTIRP